MKSQILQRFVFVSLIALIAAIFSVPNHIVSNTFGAESPITQTLAKYKVTLGLDLAGGTELDYRIDLSDAIAMNSDDEVENDVDTNAIAESVRDSLEARVNPAGIGEILVKRSQVTVDGEVQQHILIQMPPSSNVEEAKADAEQDNRLEFFAEDPAALAAKRVEIAEAMTVDLFNTNWDTAAPQVAENFGGTLETFDDVLLSSLTDSNLASQLENTPSGGIVQQIIETRIDPEFTVSEDGTLEINGSPFAREILAIARVNEKTAETRTDEVEAEASARHILFAYPGALRAPEDVKYTTKEEAKAEADRILQEVKDGGDFAELAKEYSTGPTGVDGGDLGTFSPGSMAPAFNDAVFDAEQVGLIPELVETDFGYHIIDITNLQEAGETTVEDTRVSYDLITWDTEDITWAKTPLGGAQLDIARVGYDQIGQPLVDLRFNPEGGEMFANITEQLASRACDGGACRLAIEVGGQKISTPTVREKIVGRNAQISGSFTYQSAKDLADGLNLGAIDAPVILSGQTTVEASLGQEQLQKSLNAATYGFLATILFMILMYRVPGVVAGVALIVYALIYIALLKLWPASLGGPIVMSLSGAAGIALSIGLAVDGNILIFERMKEELIKGRTLNQAIDLGFERAWSAIKDSNLTTLITCIILFSLGSSVIKGFAITLIVGTILSMFTAIIVSRNLLRTLLLIPGIDKPVLFGLSEKDFTNTKKRTGAKVRARKKSK
ncbi:protein translocase subunit SecD [bacterium]|nr:protein translocase subunit SecD [bacterium]NCQ55759.1 protein translocase subunit SecD [Candidatus Parcubacteria bacterium]NCS67708.1 protein translocase subunit SecD [Candidatus Peregrinibacteria bacterium]NCS96722.1 protein translocase subunit SecD [bacterium]